VWLAVYTNSYNAMQGRIQGRGAHPARALPKIGKKYDFLAQNRDF
jgi:hypothetical protein